MSIEFYKRIIGEIFDEAHSNNYLFLKLEGQIFGGITVLSCDSDCDYLYRISTHSCFARCRLEKGRNLEGGAGVGLGMP